MSDPLQKIGEELLKPAEESAEKLADHAMDKLGMMTPGMVAAFLEALTGYELVVSIRKRS